MGSGSLLHQLIFRIMCNLLLLLFVLSASLLLLLLLLVPELLLSLLLQVKFHVTQIRFSYNVGNSSLASTWCFEHPFAVHVQGYILNQGEIIIIISYFITTIKTAKASICCLNSAWINVVDEVCLHTTFKPYELFMAVSTDYPRVYIRETYNSLSGGWSPTGSTWHRGH
jgi:hypothetical protein